MMDDLEIIYEKRFLEKVDKNGPISSINPMLGNCWIWTGYTQKSKVGYTNGCGYGRFRYTNGLWMAHRYSYHRFVGKIDNGLMVCHKCDVRNCVNPDHLFLGTGRENIQDSIKKGVNFQKIKFCKNGHLLDGDNLIISTKGRCCRICNYSHHNTNYNKKEHSRAKLTWDQASEILNSELSRKELAIKFKVSIATISLIKSRSTWKCLDGNKEDFVSGRKRTDFSYIVEKNKKKDGRVKV